MGERFEIIKWEDGFALRHCCVHQSIDDPQIRKDIEEIVFSFRLKAVTSTYCKKCLKQLKDEEIKKKTAGK